MIREIQSGPDHLDIGAKREKHTHALAFLCEDGGGQRCIIGPASGSTCINGDPARNQQTHYIDVPPESRSLQCVGATAVGGQSVSVHQQHNIRSLPFKHRAGVKFWSRSARARRTHGGYYRSGRLSRSLRRRG